MPAKHSLASLFRAIYADNNKWGARRRLRARADKISYNEDGDDFSAENEDMEVVQDSSASSSSSSSSVAPVVKQTIKQESLFVQAVEAEKEGI